MLRAFTSFFHNCKRFRRHRIHGPSHAQLQISPVNRPQYQPFGRLLFLLSLSVLMTTPMQQFAVNTNEQMAGSPTRISGSSGHLDPEWSMGAGATCCIPSRGDDRGCSRDSPTQNGIPSEELAKPCHALAFAWDLNTLILAVCRIPPHAETVPWL